MISYLKIIQLIEDADLKIDQLGELFENIDYLNVSKTIQDFISMTEQLQKLVNEEIPADDVDKPKLLEIIDLTFALIVEIKLAIEARDQNEFNAKLYLLSFTLDDIVEIIIAGDQSQNQGSF